MRCNVATRVYGKWVQCDALGWMPHKLKHGGWTLMCRKHHKDWSS